MATTRRVPGGSYMEVVEQWRPVQNRDQIHDPCSECFNSLAARSRLDRATLGVFSFEAWITTKNSGSAQTNPNYQTLLAFKPRQVLLAERNTKVTTMMQCSNRETLALNPDQKALFSNPSSATPIATASPQLSNAYFPKLKSRP